MLNALNLFTLHNRTNESLKKRLKLDEVRRSGAWAADETWLNPR